MPTPYLRGMIAAIRFPFIKSYYGQPRHTRGKTKLNQYILNDIGMLGIISHSRVPLCPAMFAGFRGAATSFVITLICLILELTSWCIFSFGLTPMLIGIFFTAPIHRFFLGVPGE
jgi:hypothetical protein